MASSNSTRITLYTHATPNGHPISIFLEELKVSYEAIALSLSTAETGKVHNHVKAPWFLSINPNGRIPAIVDNEKNFNVFETSAILLYLQAELDQSNKFGFDSKTHPKEYSEVLQWLFFAHGGIGPMLGQASHFLRFAPEKIPYAINRYTDEGRRLLSVVDARLSKHDYLAGDKYTIADIKSHAWLRLVYRFDIDLAKDYPNVKAWVDRIDARPAVQKGLQVPEAYPAYEARGG
ncbi:ATP-dependent DNA/RNA helicase [Marasmius crinis-equi]|uniref:ATP-dependent DNA/RNA helicase n=1 Tax=Marasmius crinis-equi TaxID=585013 RepID=A0ABR3FAS1_9AGAR